MCDMHLEVWDVLTLEGGETERAMKGNDLTEG